MFKTSIRNEKIVSFRDLEIGDRFVFQQDIDWADFGDRSGIKLGQTMGSLMVFEKIDDTSYRGVKYLIKYNKSKIFASKIKGYTYGGAIVKPYENIHT